MASRTAQTQLKRARELAVKERRERKQAKKDARAAERRAQNDAAPIAEPEPSADGASA